MPPVSERVDEGMGFVKALVLKWEFYSLGDTGDGILLIVMTGRQGCAVPGSCE